MTTLVYLLKLCGIPAAQRATWFDGCSLINDTLYAPSRRQAEDIGRLFGPLFKVHRPGLHLRVSTPKAEPVKPPGYLNAAGRKAWKSEQAAVQPRLEEG